MTANKIPARALTAVELAEREVDRLSLLVTESEQVIRRNELTLNIRRDSLCDAQNRLAKAREDAKPKCPNFGDTIYFNGCEPRLVIRGHGRDKVLLINPRAASVANVFGRLEDILNPGTGEYTLKPEGPHAG